MNLILFLKFWIAASIIPVANHLWQSTLFATVAAFLMLFLRHNHARARYWLWLAASLKFLLPFSLLVALGARLPWPRHTPGDALVLYSAVQRVGQPFTRTVSAPRLMVMPPPTFFSALQQFLPWFLIALWLCIFAAIVLAWFIRWRRIAVAVKNATVLHEGREYDALQRQQRFAGRRSSITLASSSASLEPGVFGILRPVLLWPQKISERLTDAHLDAILAHELCHIRRRDNLASALHMLVDALFWFHPLVWWLGARLTAERERACDEEVLQSGTAPQIYAESVLKICEFCVASPLPCVSGVTGADLKQRITRIMQPRTARELTHTKKFLLSAALSLAIFLPLLFGLLNAPQIRAAAQARHATLGSITNPTYPYAFVSIRPSANTSARVGFGYSPDGFIAKNITVRRLICEAFGVTASQISGAPLWLDSQKFDIDASLDPSVAAQLHELNPGKEFLDQHRFLQALLGVRFKLSTHGEDKEISQYVLQLAANGPKLHAAKPGDAYPDGLKGLAGQKQGMFVDSGQLVGQAVPVEPLARFLSDRFGRPVVDQTGLTGNYDFTLKFPGIGSTQPLDPALPVALQDQLGLSLEPRSAPGEILYIDHVEPPVISKAH